ncbi:hypothetical protein [Rossellomorea marisflavi]
MKVVVVKGSKFEEKIKNAYEIIGDFLRNEVEKEMRKIKVNIYA